MNEQVLTAKKAVVAELNERLATANAAIVVGYQGLSVKELTVLRKSLKEAGARMEIQKNTLMRRAVDFEGYSALDELLTGQNAIVTSDDSICALPVLFKFVKSNKLLSLKAELLKRHIVMLIHFKVFQKLDPKKVQFLCCFPFSKLQFAILLAVLKPYLKPNNYIGGIQNG